MAKACCKCKKPVKNEALITGEKFWHADCFKCFNCKKSLECRLFHVRKNAVFCTKCYQNMYRQRCASCTDPIQRHGIRAMDAYWHTRCFRCTTCKVKLINKFYLFNRQPYCDICYKKETNEVRRAHCELPPLVAEVEQPPPGGAPPSAAGSDQLYFSLQPPKTVTAATPDSSPTTPNLSSSAGGSAAVATSSAAVGPKIPSTNGQPTVVAVGPKITTSQVSVDNTNPSSQNTSKQENSAVHLPLGVDAKDPITQRTPHKTAKCSMETPSSSDFSSEKWN